MPLMSVRTTIGGTLVEPGALITSLVSTDRVFGRTITAGGRCESLKPEQWTPVVCRGNQTLWQGEVQSSYDAADRAARRHVESVLDQAVADLFK